MTENVILSLGSNIDREHNIRSALRCLEELLGDLDVSPIYESESVGFKGDSFLNLVVAANTELGLRELSNELKSIEDSHGRVRNGPKFSSRSLDIDIVIFGDHTGKIEGIELPRPEMFYNAFVLLPMVDLYPSRIEPKTGKPYKTLVDGLPDGQMLRSVCENLT
jgi:2-amino-4-hydroxy-6-hydroxymethyldihydropteridine diphosphokinase